MPINYNEENKEWLAENLTENEKNSLIEIGKAIIISGIAGYYANDIYKRYITSIPTELCFKA